MRKTIIAIILLSCLLGIAKAQDTYFTIDDMPDLVKCLPAPPDTVSIGFTYDVMQYMWGKTVRADARRAAIAERDAIWDLDTLAAIFSVPFGLKIDKEDTPEIYNAFVRGIKTIELIRIRPKAHFLRKRPFDRFQEHMYTTWEEDDLRGEGSYPSGHAIRGWSAALILAEINPAAADRLFARGWDYGESRVIVGAHWQSDVDASRPAASIGYSLLQTSPEYKAQMDRARREFAIREAITDYLVQAIGPQYLEGEVCIPSYTLVSVDDRNDKDIQAAGDFWVFNYNVEGDTLKTVSGGSHPGKMHLRRDSRGRYAVTSFEVVADGPKYLSSAKRIFGKDYDEFQAVNSNETLREERRAEDIGFYVSSWLLPVVYYQDYGWDSIAIPR
ncbi:MAG: phosphatase PAP2 family protein [Bacteroidales bacterium]|nr:phosphatase PAP2 family protein [Bacteroidales bacterium]